MRAGTALGIAAGTGLLGAAASYGLVRWAGGSGGGDGPAAVGALGGRAIVTGGAAGLGAGLVASRAGGTHAFSGARGMLLLPVGIAGATIGGWLARRELERTHALEYAARTAAIDDAVHATRGMFLAAGVGDERMSRVHSQYDRSYFNASYTPPMGPFGDDIVVGRHAVDGTSMATLDVVAHEYAHRVVLEHAPLLGRIPIGDGGAINESLADTFAMAVDTDDWLLGEDVVDGGMRSFSHPEVHGGLRGRVPVPAPTTREELAGRVEVHLGAGVGNKVAWRIGAQLGRPELARLYVAALDRGDLGLTSSYDDLARAVRGAAADLYGPGSPQVALVDEAWRLAGY